MKRKLLAVVWLVCALSVFTTNADVPPLINYQGSFTDSTGQPVSGTKRLEFNIYDAPIAGNKVWGPQIFNQVPVINGRFNVILGATDTEGVLISQVFDGGERYLSVSMDDGTELGLRQRVLSAPYAVHAGNGVPAGTIVAFWGVNPPAGWLLCDGSQVPEGAVFERLRMLLGSGSVPDLRGLFLRGAGRNSNPEYAYDGDNETSAGYMQLDQFASHVHPLDDYIYSEIWSGNKGWPGSGSSDHDNGPVLPYRHDTEAVGAGETRPKSMLVNYIIKY